MGIFPEGVSHDQAQVQRLKTGVARIAQAQGGGGFRLRGGRRGLGGAAAVGVALPMVGVKATPNWNHSESSVASEMAFHSRSAGTA